MSHCWHKHGRVEDWNMWIYESYFELQIKVWKWTWSLQLSKKPRQLKKNLKKFRLDQFTWVGSRYQRLTQVPQVFTIIPSLFETLNSFPETAASRQRESLLLLLVNTHSLAHLYFDQWYSMSPGIYHLPNVFDVTFVSSYS